MNFLTLNALCVTTPDLSHTLIQDLTLGFGAERTGLVGRNGCGKSTLLAIMAGRAAPTRGSVTTHGTVGFLRQRFEDLTATATAALGVAHVFEATQRALAGDGTAADLDMADWTLEPRIDAALTQVGLQGLAPHTPLSHLSGGQRMRLSVARTLLEDPDLLLLDEPTNNLDAQGRDMVAGLVMGWRGGVVVAGHDRAVLENMDRMLELSQTGAQVFAGGWTAYRTERAAQEARAEATLDHAVRGLRSVKAAIQQKAEGKARRDKAGRIKGAQDNDPRVSLNRQKERAEQSLGRDTDQAARGMAAAVAAVDEASENVEVLTPVHIDLPRTDVPPGRVVLQMDAAEKQFSGHAALGPWTLEIRGAERLRISGSNGVGKTTALKVAAGMLAPTRGQIQRFGTAGYLDQDLTLPAPDGSLIDNILHNKAGLSDQDARAALARFGFRNRAAERAAAGLSGGERLRLGLCRMMTGADVPSLLVLDEPTNHLDADAVQMLETTMGSFGGAILFVTHDESFAKAIEPARTFEIAG